MRRLIVGFAAAALFGFAASDASACHHKKACAAPCPPPAPVCAPACAPVKKCHFSLPKFHMPKLGCHKKAVCAPAPACAPCETTASPQGGGVWAAGQTTAAPQAAAAAQH
jgi:hypothetical protein